MTKPNIGELIFFFVLLAGVGFLASMIMSPYLTPVFLAAVFTILFSPVFRYIHRTLGGRQTLAAALTVLFVLVVILVPLSFIGVLMFKEVVDIYQTLGDNNFGIAAVNTWAGDIEHFIQRLVPGFTLNFDAVAYLQIFLAWIAGHLNTFFSGILTFVFYTFLIVAAMFFFYRDGGKLKEFAIKWSPLADSYDQSIIAKLELAVSSVVKGALTTAVVQGLLVGTGFAIFHVPNPVLWGVVATVAALIPIVGTTLITIPAVVGLFLAGSTTYAVGLLVWSLFCVGLADNVLHPLLIKRGVHIHPFLILLSVFGGLVYFGPVGFLAGPIVMAFFFALLDVYPAIVKGKSVEAQ